MIYLQRYWNNVEAFKWKSGARERENHHWNDPKRTIIHPDGRLQRLSSLTEAQSYTQNVLVGYAIQVRGCTLGPRTTDAALT